MEYSWRDINEYVSSLPIERVITVYQHKDAKNKERYLEALCDKDVDAALSSLEAAEEEYNRRKQAIKSGG